VRNHNIALLLVASCTSFALCACAPAIEIYEAPTSGQITEITFVNATRIQEATLITFLDGETCMGRRQIYIDDKPAIHAGDRGSLAVPADAAFALSARLSTIEHEEYSVELSASSGAPSPAIKRSTAAIGCTVNLSFRVEPDATYQIVISEPDSSASCLVAVSKISRQGEITEVITTPRRPLAPRNQIGPFCEPLLGRPNGPSGTQY
jgi:hypothetical protein